MGCACACAVALPGTAQAEWAEPTPADARLTASARIQRSHIAVVNGVPHVAYRDGTALRVARLRADGSAWLQLPPPTGAAVVDSDIVAFGGQPAIAYQTSTNTILVQRFDGTAWTAPNDVTAVLSPAGVGGTGADLHVINGALWIAYTDLPEDDNIRAGELVGATFQTRGFLSLGRVQRSVTLADVNGIAAFTSAGILTGQPAQINAYRRSGGTWTALGGASAVAATAAGQSRAPDLTSIGGTAYLVWTDDAVVHVRSSTAGSAWTPVGTPGSFPTIGSVELTPSAGGLVLALTSGDEARALLGRPAQGTWTELVGGPRPLNVGPAGSSATFLDVADSGGGVPYAAWSEDAGTTFPIGVKALRPVFSGATATTTTDSATFTAQIETYGATLPVGLQRGSETDPVEQVRQVTSGPQTWTVTGLRPATDVLWRPVLALTPFVDGDGFSTARTAAAPAPPAPPAAQDPPPAEDPPAMTTTTDATPPPPPPPPAEPDPALGQTAAIDATDGDVVITKPGKAPTRVGEVAGLLPIGTKVDVTRGKVELWFDGVGGQPQNRGFFYQGSFRIVSQSRTTGLVTFELDRPSSCRGKVRAAKVGKKKNKLWGDAKGKFRTKGRYGAATVRGTKWSTEETCTSTKIAVVNGVVDAEDLVRNKTTRLTAGRSYTARTKRP